MSASPHAHTGHLPRPGGHRPGLLTTRHNRRAGELHAPAIESGDIRLMVLTCVPDGGTHPDPPVPCALLAASGPDSAEPVWGSGPSGMFRDAYAFPSLCAAESATGGRLRFVRDSQ